ncbi:MAG: hypothetical protein DDT20_01774 [Firmicutes bacterium]|nr:hypothetical protein [Bacillota bacterium]
MLALPAFYPGKTKMKVAALQVFIDYVLYKRTPVAQSLLVAIFPGTFQFFIVILNTKIVYTFPVYPWLISFNIGTLLRIICFDGGAGRIQVQDTRKVRLLPRYPRSNRVFFGKAAAKL